MSATQASTVITLAQQRLKAKQFDAAADLLADHLARNPADVDALNTLGLVRFQQGRFEDAKAAYLRMWAIDTSDHRALYGTGMALMKLGAFDDAEHWFRVTLRAHPGFDRAATRLRELEALRLAPRNEGSLTAGREPARPKLTTLSLPDSEEDLDTYRRVSRERARIDGINEHWHSIPWPARVLQIGGVVAFVVWIIVNLI